MRKGTLFLNKINPFKSRKKSAPNYLPYSSTTLPTSTFILSGSPVWRNLSSDLYLIKCYYENPVVQATINIKAKAFANMRFLVKDLDTDEIIPLNKYDSDGGRLNQLLSNPNPLQSTYEWLRQFKINYEVFGNAYNYASVPVGWEDRFSYQDVSVMNNLPSYCLAPVLTGKWIDATDINEIISGYKFNDLNGKIRDIPTGQLFHTNNWNLKLDQNFTQGESDLIALARPISNIDAAYESRNVLIRKRGALGILTPEKKDEAMGSIPLDEDEIEDVQDAFKKYGLLDDQYQQIVSPQPLKYQRMALSVKDLMLFEEIEADAIAVANGKGIPELLLKYYIKGGTFENLNASEKRLYDSTIIPESVDFMTGLNNFLRTKEYGIELIGSFEHLKILQENRKEEAGTKRKNEETAMSAFRIGAITFNDYLNAIDMPNDPEIGELRIWDLSEEQLNAISRSRSRTNQAEES